MQSVQPEPDAASAACEIRTRDGGLPDLTHIDQRLLALRVGARLRGTEITADGRVERQGADWVLCLAGSEEKLRLAPLATKVQLDPRQGRPQAPTREESLAWERLCGEWRSPAAALRVRGPLLRPAPGSMPTLEVRGFWWFSPAQPPVHALWLGLEVNGPYGLREPWAMIREGLLRSGDWEWLAEAPDLAAETFGARSASACWPRQTLLARQVSELGAGASLRGVEAAVEGWLSRENGRLRFRACGSEGPVALAPLDRKIQRDGRQRSEATKTASERGAYELLCSSAGSQPRLARVLGPVVESGDGRHWLLEVRGFVLQAAPGAPLPADWTPERQDGAGRHGLGSPLPLDTVAPAPPRALSASFRDGRIHLSWEESPEPDLDAYNVFRAATPGSGYIQIAAGIVPNRAAFRAEDPGANHRYVVTARDRSGNESGFSAEATVQIP